MPVNNTTLKALEIELIRHYEQGLQAAPKNLIYKRFTQQFDMKTKTVEAPILGQVGPLREWIGPRMITDLSARSYAITAREFEKTIGIPRDAVDDDNVGLWLPQLSGLATQSVLWPDQQVFKKLESGETDVCYDTLPFFSASHTSPDGGANWSNLNGSGNPAWYMFDTRKAIMPMVWGLRMAPEYTQLWKLTDPNVFWHRKYISGVYARGVPDYGFPQFARKEKTALSGTTYDAAQTAASLLKSESGEQLGVHFDLMVIPRVLEPVARQLFKMQTTSGGAQNPYYDAIEYVVSDRLSNT